MLPAMGRDVIPTFSTGSMIGMKLLRVELEMLRELTYI
jgi:hypothetical protein